MGFHVTYLYLSTSHNYIKISVYLGVIYNLGLIFYSLGSKIIYYTITSLDKFFTEGFYMNRQKNFKPGLQETNEKRYQKLIQSAEDVDLTLQKIFYKEIIVLCQPIFKLFNVNYFGHTRAFHNGQFVSLMTNPELTESFLKRKYPISSSEGKGFYLNAGCYISDCFMQNSGIEGKLRALWSEFHIGYLIHIIKKHANYDDMYSFGLNTEDKVFVNKFLNHLKMIEHFILYFKNQPLNILNKIEPVSYSEDYFSLLQNKSNMVTITDEE